ncbi:MAG: AMP-binding protein, partial [Deltaproteobacteria bacterium]|nr:AMP-binding protein [Deltaproteobacteria bacterium]
YLDEFPKLSWAKRVAMSLALGLFPERFVTSSELAGILFSPVAESPAIPVVLHHDTVIACLLGLQEVLALGHNDTVASSLSMTDSLAFSTAFWWPLLQGARIRHVGQNIFVEGRFVLTRAESYISKKEGVPFLTVYGCPSLPVICVNALDVREGSEDQRGQKIGSVGRPLPGICVQIVDPISGKKLPPRSSGLMLAKSATVSKMGDVFVSDGWIHTGDRASYDDEGFVTISQKGTQINGATNADSLPDGDFQSLSGEKLPSGLQV